MHRLAPQVINLRKNRRNPYCSARRKMTTRGCPKKKPVGPADSPRDPPPPPLGNTPSLTAWSVEPRSRPIRHCNPGCEGLRSYDYMDYIISTPPLHHPPPFPVCLKRHTPCPYTLRVDETTTAFCSRVLPAGNNLTRIPALQGLGKLQMLDLSKNKIGSVEPESFPPELGPNLRRLNLKGNRCDTTAVQDIWPRKPTLTQVEIYGKNNNFGSRYTKFSVEYTTLVFPT